MENIIKYDKMRNDDDRRNLRYPKCGWQCSLCLLEAFIGEEAPQNEDLTDPHEEDDHRLSDRPELYTFVEILSEGAPSRLPQTVVRLVIDHDLQRLVNRHRRCLHLVGDKIHINLSTP